MPRPSAQIMDLARRGVQHRLNELQDEIAALIKIFPDLSSARRGPKPQIDLSAEPAATIDRQPRRRKRKRMSAAARKAVSLRMKKYWAGRRNSKNR